VRVIHKVPLEEAGPGRLRLEPRSSRAEAAELVAARQKIRDLEEDNKVLRKVAAAVVQVVHPKDRASR